MKLDDILTLLNAGYTKEDIDKLAAGDPAPAPAADPEPTSAADPEPTPAPTPAPDPASASAADPAQAIKTVLDGFANDFTKKLQAFQIATSNMIPKPDDTGESVFAEIIAPSHRKE